jgi:vacuolar protein sorting-associated protein 1
MLTERCPMECSMSSNADTWSCQITLRYSVDATGRNLATPERTFFGPPITDKESVELWLRRAQAAILSPHVEHNEFYKKTFEELQAVMRTDQNVLPFSKNVIQVEVKDPDLTDLSFIDLPGKMCISFL